MDVSSSALQTVQVEKSKSQEKHGREARVGILEATGDPELDALLAMEAEEEARLASIGQRETAVAKELEHDENTDWLRGCGWPQ